MRDKPLCWRCHQPMYYGYVQDGAGSYEWQCDCWMDALKARSAAGARAFLHDKDPSDVQPPEPIDQ